MGRTTARHQQKSLGTWLQDCDGKTRFKHIVPDMNADTMFNIVNTLFPKHDIMEDDITTERQYPVTPFTQKELMDTARRLQN